MLNSKGCNMKYYYGKKTNLPKKCPGCGIKVITDINGSLDISTLQKIVQVHFFLYYGCDTLKPNFEGLQQWFLTCNICDILLQKCLWHL